MENDQLKNEEIEIDLREVAGAILSKLGLIVLVGLACALLAGAFALITKTPQYESATTMYVLTKFDTDRLTDRDLRTSEYLIQDYAKLIQSRSVTEEVARKLGLPLSHEKMLGKLSVSTEDDTRVITIKARDKDPYMARNIATEIRTTAAQQIQRVMNTEAVNVVDEANIPTLPCSSPVSKTVVMGGLLGVILAAAYVVITFMMNDTIKTPEDIERYLGLSTLGIIPVSKQKTKKPGKKKGRREKK